MNSIDAWWKNKVVYHIYPRSFNDSNNDGFGDINGVIEKIPYLKELGIGIIWLSPVYASPDDDNGYDISDYYSVNPNFGTMEELTKLFNIAKEAGIRVMMDIVVNHTSDEHEWFQDSAKGIDSKYSDYYIWKDSTDEGEAPNNWGSNFGGSAWEYNKIRDQYYLHIFGKKQPDLNWENENLRKDIYEMMNFWVQQGVSGFRLDVINMISKQQDFPDGKLRPNGWGRGAPYYYNGPRVHEYLKEMYQEVFLGNNLITVGEMPRLSIKDAQLYTEPSREELDMVFHFEHTRLGEGEFGKWSPEDWNLTELKIILADWQYGLENKGWNSLYWSNHDQPRAISRYGNDSEEYREISGKMLAICLHMHKGTPYIYQGEEIGMVNPTFDSLDDYRDIEIHQNYKQLIEDNHLTHEEMMRGIHERSRDTARTPVQWTNEKFAGFSTKEPWIPVHPNYNFINVESALKNKTSIFYTYQKLIKLREEMKIIVEGKYDLLLAQDEEVYAFTRTLENEKLIIVCNFTENIQKRDFKEYSLEKYESLINNYNQVIIEEGILQLKPYQAVVFHK